MYTPYPKKNTESNLVNQIFSFVSTPYKSMPTLMKILNQDKTKALYYYELFKAVKRGKKKYINRKFLMSLCKMD